MTEDTRKLLRTIHTRCSTGLSTAEGRMQEMGFDKAIIDYCIGYGLVAQQSVGTPYAPQLVVTAKGQRYLKDGIAMSERIPPEVQRWLDARGRICKSCRYWYQRWERLPGWYPEHGGCLLEPVPNQYRTDRPHRYDDTCEKWEARDE